MEKEIRPVLEGRYAEYEKRTEENRKLMENYARGVEELKKKGLEACVTEKVFESQEAKEEYANYLMNILDGSAHALAEPFIQLGLSAKHTAGTASGDTIGLNTIKTTVRIPSVG